MALFDAFASVAQALGSGRRAEIVDLLSQGERSVEEIANEIFSSGTPAPANRSITLSSTPHVIGLTNPSGGGGE